MIITPTLSYFIDILSYQSFNWLCWSDVKSLKSSSTSLIILIIFVLFDFKSHFEHFIVSAETGKSARCIVPGESVIWTTRSIETFTPTDVVNFTLDANANVGLFYTIVNTQLNILLCQMWRFFLVSFIAILKISNGTWEFKILIESGQIFWLCFSSTAQKEVLDTFHEKLIWESYWPTKSCFTIKAYFSYNFLYYIFKTQTSLMVISFSSLGGGT